MNTLADLCELIVDCEHKTAPVQDDGYPSIRTPNIGKGYFILDGVNRVSEATYQEWTRRAIPQPGDLILAREAPVGNVAVIPEELTCCLGQRTVLIRPKHQDVNAYYLCFLLLTPYMQGQLLGKSGGATVHHLNMRDIRSLPIPQLPDRDEQARIASVIRTYDEFIETNRRRIALLEESARLLYREWFVNLRFPGHEQVKRVDGVPEGWRAGMLGEFVKTASGGTPSRTHPEYFGGEIPWVKTKELNNGHLLHTEEHITSLGLERSSAKLFPEKTVLLAMYGATIGMISMLGIKAATNQACCAFLTAETPCLSEYIFLWLMEIREKLTGLAMGAAQPNISQDVIRKLEFIMPSENVLTAFGELVVPVLNQTRVLSMQIARLTEARDSLLPKLMSGQIRV